MKRKKLHRIFLAAREILSDKGKWTQNEFEQDGAYCLLGALRKAATDDSYDGDLDDAMTPIVHECISTLYPKRSGDITSFNDDKKTRFKHVRKVLECAIEDTKPKQQAV